MFETCSQAWREVGLLRQISPRVVKRARLEALVLVPLFIAVVVFYDNRVSLLGARGLHGRAARELVPALEAARSSIHAALKQESTVLGRRISRTRLRGILITAQVAISVTFLLLASLTVRMILRNTSPEDAYQEVVAKYNEALAKAQ